MDKQEIVEKSREILRRLGKTECWSNDVDHEGDPIIYGCKYYSYKNFYILQLGERDVAISFAGVDVFDSSSDFCELPVMWEDILDNIYNGLDAYKYEDIHDYNKDIGAYNFNKKILNNVYLYQCTTQLDINIKEELNKMNITIDKSTEYYDVCYQHDVYDTYTVTKNGKKVYEVTIKNIFNYDVALFEPGTWMDELIYLKECIDKGLEEKSKVVDSSKYEFDSEFLRMRFKYFNH